MNTETGKRLLFLQDTLWQDEEFMALSREHQEKNLRFLQVVALLSPEQQGPIWDYIGLLVEIHHKMLAFALENDGQKIHTSPKKA